MFKIAWKEKAYKQLKKIRDKHEREIIYDIIWVPEGDLLPHKVVGLTIKKGFTLARAWREYLGLTQKEVAAKMKITQAALVQIESSEKKLRKAILERLASALGIGVEQLV